MQHLFVDPYIARAKTIHTGFYSDPELFEKAKRRLFASSWQVAGNTDLIEKPGDCYPFILLEGYLNEPLLLTRDKEGRLYCLSNVCTHRGNILINEPCTATNLKCKYHGRLFSLNGKFLSMPEFKEVKNFPTEEDNLTSLPLFNWGKILFTCMEKNIVNPFEDMMKRLAWLQLNDFVYRDDLSKEYTINAHWALYCENYLEGFHIPFVHADLNAVIDYGNYTTELFRYSNLQLGIAKDDEDCFDLPTSSTDYGKKVAAYYFWVFPNMMFNFYPWGLSVNIVIPVAIAKTKVCFYTYMWDESKYNSGAGSNLDKVELEDEAIVENVQKGVQSSFYKHGRYSVTKEQGTHHFHRLVSEYLS